MRPSIHILLLSATLVTASHTRAQDTHLRVGLPFHKPMGYQGSLGLMGGALNSPGSIASGFSFLFMANFLQTRHVSLSVGSELRAGLDNKNGLGIPMSVANVLASWLSNGNATPNFSNQNYTGYYDLPLLLRLNIGDGCTMTNMQRLGFYVGGGMTYIVTGYQANPDYAESISFWGTVLEAGIRLRGLQIGFSKVFSLRQPLGPITSNPTMYELTISGMIKNVK